MAFFIPDYFTRSIPRFFKKTLPRFFSQKIPDFFQNRILEKCISYLQYAMRPFEVWSHIYSGSDNIVGKSFPNSFTKHFENVLGFIYGDDDLNGSRIARGFVIDEANCEDMIDDQWYRILNPFHLLNACIGFAKAFLFGGLDTLDRCCSPSGNFASENTHWFFALFKGLLNIGLMVVEPFVMIPLKLLGDITDSLIYAGLSIVYAPLRFLVGCLQGGGYLIKICCCSSNKTNAIQKQVRFDENAVVEMKIHETCAEKASHTSEHPADNELKIPSTTSHAVTSPTTPSSRRSTLHRETITSAKVKAALFVRKHSRQPSTATPLKTSTSAKDLLRTQPAFHKREGSKSLHNLKLVIPQGPVLTIQVNDNSFTPTTPNATTVSGSPSTMSPLEMNSVTQNDRNLFFSNSSIPGAVNTSPKNAQLSS